MKENILKLRAFVFAFLLLSLCITFSKTVYAASPTYGRLGVLYNSDNGLPTSEANAIAQTGDGFIWIGSYGGLVRYDGTNFQSFDSVNGVPGVVSLFVDSKDRLWIGTNDNGVALFENEEFTSYSDSEALSSHSIRAISEDADGNIIIATTMGLGYVDENDELHALNETQLNGEYINSLKADEDGVIYGTTETGSVFTLENLRIRDFYDVSTTDFGAAQTITPDPDDKGYAYIPTYDSTVIRMNISSGEIDENIITIDGVSEINDVMPIDDLIYLCTDDGIGYIDGNGEFLLLDDLALNNSVDSMLSDSEGNLWFTSSRQGILKLVPNDFIDLMSVAGLDETVVNATCLRGGLLYVGSDSGLLIFDADYNLIENELTEMLNSVRIRSIRTDSTGRLYISTYSDYGLVILESDDTISTLSEENGLASNKVRTSLVLNDGKVAVATGAGVTIFSDGAVTDVLDAEKGVKNSAILCLAEKSDGTLLMGSDGDGIYSTKGGNTKRYGRSDGLSSEVVMRIVPDPVEEDAFWIVTSNLIDYMDSDGNISNVEKFPYADNFDLYFDDENSLWILSGTGLYVVDRESLFDDGEPDITLYDGKNGLPSSPTANSYSCISDDGTLYISSATGVTAVNMEKLSELDDILQLNIPYVEADDTIYTPDENGVITLPSGAKRISVNAHAITYSLKNPKVSYILDGFDEDIETVTRLDLDPIVYTNLDGGKYTFILTALNSDGSEDSENSISVIIDKQLALYERPLVRILGILLLIAVIALIIWRYFRKRTRALERQNEQRRAFINQTVHAFAKAIDFKDRYTNGHSFRVANYTRLIASHMDYTDEQIENMYNIALLHDIGKLSIPDSILNKPAALDDDEYEIMKSHAKNGYDILSEITSEPELAWGAGYHHERIDGKGYPNGVKGDEIPMVAQIIAVADTFDAMYSTRPYRKKLELSYVLDEIKKIAGTQLNPDIVKVFVKLCEDGEVK